MNDRRASAALTLLLAFLVLAGTGGYVGFSMLQSKRLELATRQSQLEMLQQRRPVEPEPAAETPITVKPFLAEDSFALAANALQKRVVGVIEETGGKLMTVSVDPPAVGDDERARRVSVQVTAELTNEALQKALYELETAVPFAFVDSFSASRKAAGQGSEKGASQTEPRMSVALSVAGYRRKAASQ